MALCVLSYAEAALEPRGGDRARGSGERLGCDEGAGEIGSLTPSVPGGH